MPKPITIMKLATPALALLSLSACESDPTASLRADWRKCVADAFRTESATTADKSKAADAAFLSCQAQENVLFKKAAETNPYAEGAQNQLREREKGRLLKQP